MGTPAIPRVYKKAYLLTIIKHFGFFINRQAKTSTLPRLHGTSDYCHHDTHTDALNAGTDMLGGNSVGM